MAKGTGLNLKALISLETKQFQQGLNKIKKQLNGFGNFLKSAFAVGSITAFGKQMVNVSKDFEDAMARVKAITNASTTEFEAMSKEARKMGETTRYTASEAANALENLTRNGMSASQATKALSGVMQLAQANAIGLAEAADIVTNTLNMFGLSVENTTRVNDVLSSTAGNAATNITELYEAMVNAAPAARVLNFDIEEVSAAIGALAQAGVKGSDAGTQLRMSLTKMADPKIIAKMQEMGVQIDEQSMKEEGLLKTVQKLRDAHLDLTDLVKIFSQRGAVGMQQLINSYEDFNKLLDVTKNSAGTTARMFEQGVGTTRKELDTLKSMYEGLLLTIGNKTSGVVNSTVKLLQNLINNFKSVGGVILNIASVVVPLLVRKVMVLGKTATTTLGAIKTGVAGVKAAMGGWVTIVATLVTWIGTALYGAWAKVNQPIKDAKKNMGEVESSTTKLKKSANDLINELGPETDDSTLAGVIKRLCELYPDFASEIQNAYWLAGKTKNWDALKRVLQDIVDLQEQVKIKEAQGEIYSAEVKKLGLQMYNMDENGRRTGITMQTPPGGHIPIPTYNPGKNEIRKALEEAGYEAEQIKAAFEVIAEISTNAKKSELEKVQEINKYLYDVYGIKGLGVSAVRPYVRMAEKSLGKAFANPSRTSENMARTDSTSNVLLFDKFQADSLLVRNAVDAGELKKDEGYKQLHDDLIELESSVDKATLTIEQRDQLDEWRKLYGTAPDIKPAGGGSGGSGSTGKTETEKLSDVINDYTKKVEELNRQTNAGALTQDDYKKSIQDLNTETWKAITAFNNFEYLLSGLPDNLKNVVTQLVGDIASQRASDAIEKAVSQRQDLLGNYGYAQMGKQNNKFSYMEDYAVGKGQTFSPAQKNAMQAHVELSLDYAETLEALTNKLREAIAKGSFDLIKDEALEMLHNMEEELVTAKNEATAFEHVLKFSEAQEQLADLQEQLKETTINGVEELARSFGSVTNALTDIFEIFDEDIRDSEFYKGIQAFMTVLNSFITIFETARTVIEAFGTAQKIQAQIATQSAAKQVAADMAVASAEGTKAAASAGAAAAGAGSSVSSIPIVGPILAVAAIGTVVAAILAAMSKFATGGIVGGSSTTGDKQIVRANSGELILTKGQQATLFNAIQSGNLGGGGNVEFRLRGADLIGAIENTQARRRG